MQLHKTTALKSLTRDSLSTKVADSLRLAILNGEYELGERLRELELTSMYSVSSSVLREALHVLQGEGLVVGDPYRGKRIFNMTEAECSELTVARASMESLAAYLAAQRMNEEDARRITSAAEKFRDVPATYADHAALELDFHRSIWEASRNEWLAKLLIQIVIPLLSMAVQRMLTPDLEFEAFCRKSPALEAADPNRHEVMAKELINGQADRVRARMFRHITEARIQPGPNLTIISSTVSAMRPNDLGSD